MRKIPSVLSVVLFLFSATAFAGQKYPLQEYEVLVIESLPEAMSLDMTLTEIEKTKESSRLGGLKRRLNKTIFQKIAPLLAGTDFSQGFNMLQLPKLLPLKEIVKEMNLGDGEKNATPADFIIMISPKLPVQFGEATYNPYARLYPTNKASVVSLLEGNSNGLMSYEGVLNQRMQAGADYLFERQYANGAIKSGFFAGALISIHAEGAKSWAKAKVAVGLPTDQAMPFEQENDQIKLTQIIFPRTPYKGFVKQMENPIAMITLEQYNTAPMPLLMKMSFGSMGPMKDHNWLIGSAPSDSIVNRWLSYMNPYNVPHFRGEIRKVADIGWIDSFLGWGFDIQLNLHEVTIDLTKIEITDVRMTIALPAKGYDELIPIFRLSDPETQFKNEGNKVLSQEKAKVEAILNNGLGVLADKDAQKLLFDTINKLISAKGAQ